MVDALVVGTHPDDIELGFGASVALMVEAGMEVAMLDLTNGEPTPFGNPQTRVEEAKQAADILGIKERIILGLPNRELEDSVPARHKVAEVYRKLRPNILFIQDNVDAHPDHIASSAIAEKARFDAKLTKTNIPGEPFYPPKLMYYFASHLKLHAQPSFILDVSSTFEKKLEAILAYKSQFAASGREAMIVDRFRKIGAYFGYLIGTEYGEPVMSKEEIGLSSVRDLVL